LLSAFGFMLTLVLSANLFADAVQKALDPRIKTTTLSVNNLKESETTPSKTEDQIPTGTNKPAQHP